VTPPFRMPDPVYTEAEAVERSKMLYDMGYDSGRKGLGISDDDVEAQFMGDYHLGYGAGLRAARNSA
jgi:hypothetical protein